jgi:hypothetical protein
MTSFTAQVMARRKAAALGSGAQCGGADGFSLAEEMAGEVDNEWIKLKVLGNASLKEDHPARAAELYERAWSVTMAPYPQLSALRELADEHPGSSLARALALEGAVLRRLTALLVRTRAAQQDFATAVGGVKVTLSWPNLPAAICRSNRAAALLALPRDDSGDDDRAADALADALDACRGVCVCGGVAAERR